MSGSRIPARRSPLRTRAAAVAALAGGVVLLSAVPAFAHVTVQPNTAAKGSYSTVAFKVPNEQDKASTVRVEVNLPADHPIASVSLQPVPGWTAQVTTSKLTTPLKTDDGTVDQAVTKIVWTGGKIAPGQFQQFPVSLGPLPDDAGSLVFKTLQTYDNGDIVRWIEVPQTGQPEPQNPAPSLTLTAAATGGTSGGAAGTPAAAPAGDTSKNGKAPATASSGSSSDDTARGLGIAGIVVGAAGVGFGVFAGRRRSAGDAGTGSGASA
ncbi:YcnI family protein [Actinacidiphila acidipaludis]|uniref:YcnI family protein n=1 Tax=Actinacidiphila acidipaludis TaxID=2873382 RepID=A0ABS7Q8B8_9ACTN|nr:YcnI family protein [Streptomyces acidipaludis]MBY8879198.1 YcnI family protein [Streptomyces acidipaludis]